MIFITVNNYFEVMINLTKMSIIFGRRLKELRSENKLTQEQLGKLFNTTKVTIHAWETNKQEPNIDNIIRLAVILKTTTDYLLGLEDEAGCRAYTINNMINDNHGTINQTINNK